LKKAAEFGAACNRRRVCFSDPAEPIAGDDPFFMLNTAKWIVAHHQIPWTDVFSYTAQ
jgi:hypothetical protein